MRPVNFGGMVMPQQDSLRALLDDVQDRKIGRRDFLQRGIALGMTPKAMTAVLGAAGVAVPSGLAAAAGAQEAGGSFIEVLSSDPETLDPHITSNSFAWTVFTEIYSSLVYQDIDLSFKGLLAED